MNRNACRKLKKQGVSNPSIMQLYRDEAYNNGFQDGIKHTHDVFMIMTAYVLKNHLDLGKDKLPEIMHWLHLNISSFGTGHLTRADIPAIKEELKEVGCEF